MSTELKITEGFAKEFFDRHLTPSLKNYFGSEEAAKNAQDQLGVLFSDAEFIKAATAAGKLRAVEKEVTGANNAKTKVQVFDFKGLIDFAKEYKKEDNGAAATKIHNAANALENQAKNRATGAPADFALATAIPPEKTQVQSGFMSLIIGVIGAVLGLFTLGPIGGVLGGLLGVGAQASPIGGMIAEAFGMGGQVARREGTDQAPVTDPDRIAAAAKTPAPAQKPEVSKKPESTPDEPTTPGTEKAEVNKAAVEGEGAAKPEGQPHTPPAMTREQLAEHNAAAYTAIAKRLSNALGKQFEVSSIRDFYGTPTFIAKVTNSKPLADDLITEWIKVREEAGLTKADIAFRAHDDGTIRIYGGSPLVQSRVANVVSVTPKGEVIEVNEDIFERLESQQASFHNANEKWRLTPGWSPPGSMQENYEKSHQENKQELEKLLKALDTEPGKPGLIKIAAASRAGIEAHKLLLETFNEKTANNVNMTRDYRRAARNQAETAAKTLFDKRFEQLQTAYAAAEQRNPGSLQPGKIIEDVMELRKTGNFDTTDYQVYNRSYLSIEEGEKKRIEKKPERLSAEPNEIRKPELLKASPTRKPEALKVAPQITLERLSVEPTEIPELIKESLIEKPATQANGVGEVLNGLSSAVQSLENSRVAAVAVGAGIGSAPVFFSPDVTKIAQTFQSVIAGVGIAPQPAPGRNPLDTPAPKETFEPLHVEPLDVKAQPTPAGEFTPQTRQV